MRRRVWFVIALFLAASCGSSRTSIASGEDDVFAFVAGYINVPPGVDVVIADRSEAYQPWLSGSPVGINSPSSIEPFAWKDLLAQYALINREVVEIPSPIGRRGEGDATFTIALSRPAFSPDRSLALLTYSTSWRSHGTVAAMLLRRTPDGWQHVATVPLVGA